MHQGFYLISTLLFNYFKYAVDCFVFKIRFIIEKVFGHIKNFKSLVSQRNTQSGHMMIDYRIACAMYNFTHIPCEPDGVDSILISSQIRDKIMINQNPMNFFLKCQLGTRFFEIKTFDFVKNEFPRLTTDELKKSITYSSYLIRLSRSYIGDLIRDSKVFQNTNILIDELIEKNFPLQLIQDMLRGNVKIIGIEVIPRFTRSQSRNSRGQLKYTKKHKVFIQYIINRNNPTGIQGKNSLLCFI